ncbi:unnamed protein product [Cylicocyclus nassatus]|uniref:Uncharacterized protein n=1 Tax=Cylicocyclus nassatus TaxID=53992 RepID=A0AA36MDX3_CYLNA|nr:unnamed protein product [Cylicocyclus nassatus]
MDPYRPSSNQSTSDVCVVCGDKAIGKHYGAVACNGCKGFFRRSVFQNLQYTCRFDKSCHIDKDHRNACRFCRFQKCLTDGMRPEAIQNERDRIGAAKYRKRLPLRPSAENTKPEDVSTPATDTSASRRLLQMLVFIEQRVANSQTINKLLRDDNDSKNTRQQTMINITEWASMLHPLPEIPFSDKMLLLRQFFPSFSLLNTVQKSVHLPYLLLPNDQILGMTPSSTSSLTAIHSRIQEELIVPLRRLGADETEFGFLKALVLLNGDVAALSEQSKDKLREARDALLKALFGFYSETCSALDASFRVSCLLLIIPSLLSIAHSIVDTPSVAELFGISEVGQKQKDESRNIARSAEKANQVLAPLITEAYFTHQTLLPQQGDVLSRCNTSPTFTVPVFINTSIPMNMHDSSTNQIPTKVFLA